MRRPIRARTPHNLSIQRSPQGLRGVIRFTVSALLSLHDSGSIACSLAFRVATKQVSSSKSVTVHNARPSPMATSGSGGAASVHCGGTAQIRPSSKRSNRRLPARLARWATKMPRSPEYGWNGCVTVTKCCGTGGVPAFRTELQAAREGAVRLALGEGRHGVADSLATRLSTRRDRLAEPAVFLAPAERWIGVSISFLAAHFRLHLGEFL